MIKLKSILLESIRLKNLLLQEVDVKIGSQTSGLMQVSRRANNDTVNQELLDDIKTAARNANVKVQISWAMSGHSTKTVTGNISRHSTNDAVDISMLQDLDDSNETKLRGAGGASNSYNGKKTFRVAGNRLKDALVALGYNWNSERGHKKAVLWQTTTGGNHFNHLHVSNRDGDTSSYKAGSESNKIDMISGLKYGSRGQDVRDMQERLIYLGFSVGNPMNDGIFGPYTRNGVKDFQKEHKLDITLVYDNETKSKLIDLTKDVSAEDIKAASNKQKLKTPTIDSDSKGETTSGIKIARYLMSNLGYSLSHAAGIAGNLFVESGYNTNAVGDRGTSYGLAQWHNSRWNSLVKFCKRNKLDSASVKGQLDYLHWELNNTEPRANRQLMKTNTPYDAAYAFAKYFERPARISPKRMNTAKKIFDQLK